MLLHCDEFLDLLEKSPNLDSILSLSSYGSTNCAFFMDRKYIDEYRKHQFIAQKTKLANLEPKVRAFNMLLE